jgi:DNA-binding winged helix-turn-helix (wHTH) protein
MEQDRYTLTYRAAEARQAMNWIAAGQSGCLIGLRGGGKSNFLRFLIRQDVRRHYLGQDYADFAFALLDLLALAEFAEWAVYKLMLDRLLGIEEEIFEKIAALHREVRRSRDPLTAQWAVERCVDLLCRRPAQRIILLFDAFDAVFRALDPSLFRCLRAIRDAHKGQISYIIVIDDELACLRDDWIEVEHFYRLVSRNVCGLGPYNEADARQMIRYLAAQRSIELSGRDTARLIKLCGGHAGLIKAIMSLLWNTHQGSGGSAEFAEVLAELAPALRDEPAVQAECRKVWDSVSESEQATLCMLADGAQADPHTLRRLKLKGLVQERRSETFLFSPLFADFVRQQAPLLAKSVIISRSRREVQIDRRCVETLTELEFEMLCYLYEHRGRVCTKDELIANVYRQRYDKMTGGVTDEALQTLIARLRTKIEPDRKRPRYIITVRGEGYRFVEPRER